MAATPTPQTVQKGPPQPGPTPPQTTPTTGGSTLAGSVSLSSAPHQQVLGGHRPAMGPGQTPGPRPGIGPVQTPGPRPAMGPGHTPGPRPGIGPVQTPGPRPAMGLGQTPGPRPGIGPVQTPGPRLAMGPGQTPGPRPGIGPAQTPGPRPAMGPGQTPGPRPGIGPAQTPGPRPAMGPGQTPGPRPGIGPVQIPGPRPAMGPGQTPGPRPGIGPAQTPGPRPAMGPGQTPGPRPGTGPEQMPVPRPGLAPRQGPAPTQGFAHGPTPGLGLPLTTGTSALKEGSPLLRRLVGVSSEVLVDGQYVKMAGRMAVWDCLYVLCVVTALLTTVLALAALLMPLWFTLYLPSQDRKEIYNLLSRKPCDDSVDQKPVCYRGGSHPGYWVLAVQVWGGVSCVLALTATILHVVNLFLKPREYMVQIGALISMAGSAISLLIAGHLTHNRSIWGPEVFIGHVSYVVVEPLGSGLFLLAACLAAGTCVLTHVSSHGHGPLSLNTRFLHAFMKEEAVMESHLGAHVHLSSEGIAPRKEQEIPAEFRMVPEESEV